MRLLNDYTSGRFTEETYGRLGAELDRLTLEQSVALASKLSRANRYDQALDLLERIAKRYPDAETRDLYRGVRIRALFNSRNYTTLLSETRDVKLDDPALLLIRARAAWRNEQGPEFLSGLDALEKNYPTSREAGEAKVLRARYYSADVVDYPRAIENLSKAIDAGLLGNDGENLWTLGWTYVLAQKPDDALSVFDRYIRSYPDGDYKTNSLFWSAKVLDRLGRTAERDAKAAQIVAEYPFSYYAYRAKELWSVPAAEPAAATQDAAAANVFPDIDAALAGVNGLDMIRELLDIGLTRAAAREMKTIAAQFPDNSGVQFMLANVYVRGGEPFKANGILQRQFRQFVRHGGTNIPRAFWEVLFPLPHLDVIRAEAAKRGLDPYLVASIIRQESGFEPTTVSNAGAVGLMQIMPQEAAAIAAAGGIEGVTRESLFDPAINIAVGAAELSQKLARMNGNETLAIAAYNGGEDNVNRWLTRTPIDDVDVFIESIPFAETRLYVKTVTRNRNEYKRVYP
jgi:soluble lytic murein transglycosylase